MSTSSMSEQLVQLKAKLREQQLTQMKANLRERLFAKNDEFINQVLAHNNRVRLHRAEHGTPTPSEENDSVDDSDDDSDDSVDDSAEVADDYYMYDLVEKNPVILAWKNLIRTIIDFLVVSCRVANMPIPDLVEMRQHLWKTFTKLDKMPGLFAKTIVRSQIGGHSFLTRDEAIACCNAVQYESNLRSEGMILCVR